MTIRTEVKTMALENLFDMVKADRYTQDGREAVIKAREAEVEDRVYQNGEISQATGLMKTPNGWVEPPKGKKPGAKKEAGGSKPAAESKPAETDKVKNAQKVINETWQQQPRGAGSLDLAGVAQKAGVSEEEMKSIVEKTDGFKVSKYMDKYIIEPSTKKESKTKNREAAPSETGVPIQGSNWLSLPSGTRVTNEGAKEKMARNNDRIETIKKMMEGRSKADNFRLGSELKSLQDENEWIASRLPPEKKETPATTSSAPKAPKPSVQEYMKAKQRVKAYEDQYKKDMDDYEYMERIKANGVDPSIFNPMYGGKPKPLEENKSYMEELNKIKAYEAQDAAYTAQSINAPREKLERTLTGDTRIRVRK